MPGISVRRHPKPAQWLYPVHTCIPAVLGRVSHFGEMFANPRNVYIRFGLARHPSPARIYNRVADILIIFLSHFGCFDFCTIRPVETTGLAVVQTKCRHVYVLEIIDCFYTSETNMYICIFTEMRVVLVRWRTFLMFCHSACLFCSPWGL